MDSLASAIFSATFSGSSLGISSRLAPRSCTKSGCDEFLRGVTYLPLTEAGCFGHPLDEIIIKNKHSLAVNFREVVHSVRTGNADVAKP